VPPRALVLAWNSLTARAVLGPNFPSGQPAASIPSSRNRPCRASTSGPVAPVLRMRPFQAGGAMASPGAAGRPSGRTRPMAISRARMAMPPNCRLTAVSDQVPSAMYLPAVEMVVAPHRYGLFTWGW